MLETSKHNIIQNNSRETLDQWMNKNSDDENDQRWKKKKKNCVIRGSDALTINKNLVDVVFHYMNVFFSALRTHNTIFLNWIPCSSLKPPEKKVIYSDFFGDEMIFSVLGAWSKWVANELYLLIYSSSGNCVQQYFLSWNDLHLLTNIRREKLTWNIRKS